jgi:hypothetical protein
VKGTMDSICPGSPFITESRAIGTNSCYRTAMHSRTRTRLNLTTREQSRDSRRLRPVAEDGPQFRRGN